MDNPQLLNVLIAAWLVGILAAIIFIIFEFEMGVENTVGRYVVGWLIGWVVCGALAILAVLMVALHRG